MKGLSGFETKAQLTAVRGDVPVVFITASNDVGLDRSVLEAGGVTLLRKPFSNDALLEAVTAALGRTP
jgi:FixJ family two-component response regulator